MTSKEAVTRVQVIIIASIIIVAAVVGGVVAFWPREAIPPPGKGFLKVEAFVGTTKVTASVDVEDVGVHSTSFKIAVDPGNYSLTATHTYSTYPTPPPKLQSKTVEVVEGESTAVDFTFPETIKIGICADLDDYGGKSAWEGAVLAAEQVNAEGGIMGRYFELVGEDSDETAAAMDLAVASNALTRLITFHRVDFVIGGFRDEATLMMQDIIAEHKKIFISIASLSDTFTQRVLEDYDKYKYYFRVAPPNATTLFQGLLSSLAILKEYTGFNKIGYLAVDLMWTEDMRAGLDYYLPEVYGFDLVYRGAFPPETLDFSSYFAAMEAAGAEILIPLVAGQQGILIVKEWYDRQSPLVVWGSNVVAEASEYWEWTGGKCEHEVTMMSPFVAGYPLTNKTLPARAAFIDRWGHSPIFVVHGPYDTIRYLLPDAIERAATTETEAVIKALEETDIETTDSRRFAFTSSHDFLFAPGYGEILFFQWQADGTRVPVYPKEFMEEAGATYTFPSWPGPWD